MSVITPSTWGMITAESRDFRVATDSVVSSTGTSCATTTFTGIAVGPCACGSVALLQPVAMAISKRSVPATRDVHQPFRWLKFWPAFRILGKLPRTTGQVRGLLSQSCGRAFWGFLIRKDVDAMGKYK